MTNFKSILIVCYSFPPSNEIGGKRWYNLGNELAHENEVDIISSTPNIKKENFNKIYYIPSNYPAILDTRPVKIFEKIKYRFALLKQNFFTKGSYYDKGINNFIKLKELILEITEHKSYDIIISTGAPFSWLKAAIEVKIEKKFKSTLIYSDLRDPWTWGKGYGMKDLSSKRFNYEKSNEKAVIINSDKVIVPNQIMYNYIRDQYEDVLPLLLPHGYNKEKIDGLNLESIVKEHKGIKMVYGGTWYKGNEALLTEFLNDIKKNKNDIEIEFFTKKNNFLYDFKDFQKRYNNVNIRIKNYLKEEDYFRKIRMADYYLIFFPSCYKDFISAKFVEICYIGTPIIYVGEKGLVSNFLEKNHFGICLFSNKLNEILNHKIDFIPNKKRLEELSFKELAKKII